MECKPLPQLVLFLLICVGLAATLRARQLPIKIYTSADGLGTSAILRVVSDTRGFIWFVRVMDLSALTDVASSLTKSGPMAGLPNMRAQSN